MSIVLMFVCLIIAFLVNFTRKTRNRRFYQLLEQFPTHPSYYPLIGNAQLLAGSLEGVLEKVEKIMKPYDRLVYWLGPLPVLVLKKFDDISAILNQSVDREDIDIMKEWLGTGILNAKYEEWKKSRRVLSPAFSSDMLPKYAQVFDKNASKLIDKLRNIADNDEQTDVLDWIRNANLDSIVENSMGMSIESCGKAGENFCYSIMEAMKQGTKRIQYPWLIPHYIYMVYAKLTGKMKNIEHLQYLPTKILKDKMKNNRVPQDENNPNHNVDSTKTIIDLLIKKSPTESGFDEMRMRDELLLMTIGGVETTALTVSSLMLMLAINQDIQQKAYEEVTQLTTNQEGLTEDHSTTDFKYLEQCIKETLRMFSPIMVTSRRTHKEIVLKDNKVVPANMFVATLIHLANYDADLYENPDKWDPEHFSEQAVEKRPKNSQLSFGYGSRSCIGAKYAMMSIKTLIIHIIRNYHLSTSLKEFTKENLKTDLCIRSKIGYPIKLTSR
ncbi:cytochrome P450 4g15-like isoform X2 [Planococcus citri]|uniref:cytochrome P450 4g15-like isoform X2 n=1 Tax=Planococcus citri TaxID=170843 RepID=UPI0031F90A4E